MKRPERPFFFTAAAIIAVNIGLFLIGAPPLLRLIVLIVAVLVALLGIQRQRRDFR